MNRTDVKMRAFCIMLDPNGKNGKKFRLLKLNTARLSAKRAALISVFNAFSSKNASRYGFAPKLKINVKMVKRND